MKFYSKISMVVLIVMFSHNLYAQFKIVGYIRAKTSIVEGLKTIDLKKVTHLNIAFINPDTAGNFKPMPELDDVVRIAHQNNVKVLMSCGGGSRQAYYGKLLQDMNRGRVVDNFVDFVVKYNLDGLDVDIEGDDIDSHYESFIVELKKGLLPKQKLLTAAVAYYTRAKFSDLALRQFDFINMMAYDKTGPWRPENPGQHSPMSYALDHLDYWKSERKIAKDKLVIGVPFYGYGFGTLPESDKKYKEMFYKDIVTMFPGAERADEVVLPNEEGTVYYNGIKTIQKKTELALKKAGGVMIWELLQDSNDKNSLLKAINDTVAATKEK